MILVIGDAVSKLAGLFRRAMPYTNDYFLSAHCAEFTRHISIIDTYNGVVLLPASPTISPLERESEARPPQ